MTGEALPKKLGKLKKSPLSAFTSPDDSLEEVRALENALNDSVISAKSARATPKSVSSAPTSRCSSPLESLRQAGNFRSNSFQRWKRQMQRAWRWGADGGSLSGGNREQSLKATLNLEIMAKQKRLWYRAKSENRDLKQHREPTLLFEQFFIVGLHSHANVEVIADAFAKRKVWESESANIDIQYNGQRSALEPQVLFKYPPVKRVAMKESDIPAFCFPEGVKASLVERTPSMSDLNDLVFGQEHLARDDLSFIFCLKVSDDSTLYGVCIHVQELVERAPAILGAVSPLSASNCKPNRFLVAAPRCYCILTRVPFFELHFEMLNSIISQERLDRITQFVSDTSLVEPVSPVIGQNERFENNLCPERESFNSLMGCVIPVDNVAGIIVSPAVTLSDREAAPVLFRPVGFHSPESASFSEVSDTSHVRELDKESRKSWQCLDDLTSENSGYGSDSFERDNGVFENGQASPEVYSTINRSTSYKLERVASLESIYSSVRCLGSEDEDDDFSSKFEAIASDEKVIGWAKENNNEPLQIVCGYHTLPIPALGREIVFQPLEHLQPISYSRPDASSLGLDCYYDIDLPRNPEVIIGLNARLGAAEEAFALSTWSVATVCRALSLENVLALVSGTLLEKQVVVICPNLGILSAIVLSVIPIIRPFEWQSLFLPVLPRKMLDFLDAPVPFIMGIQQKPFDKKMKASNLIKVNVCKNKVKMCILPQLPSYSALVSELTAVHARLACEDSIAKRHPVYKCSEAQAEAADNFLRIFTHFMESLCSNFRSHTITNVQANNDKVSLLLKDSYVDSFPVKDQPFMKLFVDTQLFSVLSDSRMSSFENEKP